MEELSFKLEIFEGPLDLMLSLIAKHKLNIRDIEISILLEQFLLYLDKMQEADIVISRYFSDKERSAELLNYCFFQGKDIIKPEYLTELDGNLNALDERKKGEKRYGDQIWKVKLPEAEVLVGVEHQMKVHYFMPFRQWGYELRQYEKNTIKSHGI